MSGDDSLNVFCTITSDNGPRVPVTISKSSTPTELREKVSEATRIPLDKLRLIFRGRMIKDDASSKVVDEYKVEPDCVLHCMGKPVVAADTTSMDATMTSTTTAAFPTVSVPTATAASLPLPLGDPLQAALQQLRANNGPSVYTTAVTTLEKVLSNIANHPMEDKYRKVKVQNAAFQKRLGGLTGGDAAMKAVGFYITTTSDGDQVYDLNASPEAWPKLMAATATIGAAVQEAKRATQTNAPIMPPPAGMMGGMPNMPAGLPNMPGGMPGMPTNMNMNDPQMQSAMANMMSNPEALGTMLQNPMVQQMIQNDPNVSPMLRQSMQQLAQNPSMLQQVSQMMSDPTMRQQMQTMMANGGGGMPAGMPMPNFSAAPTAQPPSSNSNSIAAPPPRNDSDQTEEEMIAEAIRRSLEES